MEQHALLEDNGSHVRVRSCGGPQERMTSCVLLAVARVFGIFSSRAGFQQLHSPFEHLEKKFQQTFSLLLVIQSS